MELKPQRALKIFYRAREWTIFIKSFFFSSSMAKAKTCASCKVALPETTKANSKGKYYCAKCKKECKDTDADVCEFC